MLQIRDKTLAPERREEFARAVMALAGGDQRSENCGNGCTPMACVLINGYLFWRVFPALVIIRRRLQTGLAQEENLRCT